MKPTWEKPKTTKVYLHAPGSNRILMLQPEGKITNLALKNEGRHTRQDACGVHMIAGLENPTALDYRLTRYDTVRDGLPFYTVLGEDPENGAKLSMAAFATNDANPLTYVRITVTNDENYTLNGRVGLLPREARNGDQYLTGILDTGYEAYQPNFNQWLLQRIVRFSECSCAPMTACSTGGASLRLLDNGGCNVQYALNPETSEYYLIEVNPRVSRSSALASKASGYPIARVTAKIAVGMTLEEIAIANTTAAFEPKLDYVIAKLPRFPFDKFTNASNLLGTQMKATGEVMGIGSNLEEALLDVLVRYCVIDDDNAEIVAAMDGSRVLYDKANPRTEVIIEYLEGGAENEQS